MNNEVPEDEIREKLNNKLDEVFDELAAEYNLTTGAIHFSWQEDLEEGKAKLVKVIRSWYVINNHYQS